MENKYIQSIDKGWEMPKCAYPYNGEILYRNGKTDKTKDELLASPDWKLPELMVMNDGSPVTAEKWAQRREEILYTVREYGFGHSPAAPEKLDAEIVYSSASKTYAGTVKSYAGKAIVERIDLSFDAPYGRFTFPIQLVRPIYEEKPPVIIHLAFNPSLRELAPTGVIETPYAPIEEIIDNGFAYVHLCYNDIIKDNFGKTFPEALGENGMGKVFYKPEGRAKNEWGKISMWAWAGSRVVDYLLTRDDIDKDCISVAGHSRLGKTALWCGAQDERIFATLVNCSGWGGAGLTVGLDEDKLKTLVEQGYMQWWCDALADYKDNFREIPYDAHFMVAACAPRYVNILSADGDMSRYQLADFMSAAAASPAFAVQGLKGFQSDPQIPCPTVVYNEGHIGYALRPGSHHFSRWDWNRHMEFVLKHRGEK